MRRRGYANDDLYALHDKTAIARKQQAAAEARKAEAEARRAEWEAKIAEAQALAAENGYYDESGFEPLQRYSGRYVRECLCAPSEGIRVADLPDAVELLQLPLRQFVHLCHGVRSGFLQHHHFRRRGLGRAQIHNLDVRNMGRHALRRLVFRLELLALVVGLSQLRMGRLELGLRLHLV